MMKMKYIKPFIEVLMLDIESILLQNSGPQSGDADAPPGFFDEEGEDDF